MDFVLDDEQTALRDAVRGALKGYEPADPGWGVWPTLAELGALGLSFPEEAGGAGAGPVELAVVAEELGRAGVRDPYVEVIALAGTLLGGSSAEVASSTLRAVAEGEQTVVFADGPVELGDSDIGSVVGVVEPVPFGAEADTILVRIGDDLHLVDAADTDRTGYATADRRTAARIDFDGAPSTVIAEGIDGPSGLLARARATAQTMYAVEALGAMEAAVELTTGYLKSRQQFGVTLNRFQALTFRAADLYTSIQLARSIGWWAAMVLAEGSTEAGIEAAARAKLFVGRAARHVGQEAIQLHGGIGMTAEYSVGHYTARLTAINHLLGSPQDQVRVLSGSLADHGVLDPLAAAVDGIPS